MVMDLDITPRAGCTSAVIHVRRRIAGWRDVVSKAVVDLLDAVETLLSDGRGLPKPKLALRDQDYDPDDFDPDQVPR